MEIRVKAPRDHTGYGSMALQILKKIDAEGVKVKLYEQEWSRLGHEHENPEDTKLLNKMIDTEIADQNVPVFYIGLPQMRKRVLSEKIVQMTLWEVSDIPPQWVAPFNSCDLVITTTQSTKDAMIRGGVRKPIEVIPLGVDTGFFSPDTAEIVFRDTRGVRLRDFTFLSVFEWNIRKGYDILIPAFEEEFKDEPVNLVVKSYSHRNLHSPAVGINKLRKDKYSKIFLIDTVTPQSVMRAVYNCSDSFVLLTMGEGWCMPAMEAISCNLPVVVTNTTGIREYYPEEYKLELVRTHKEALGTRCRIYEWFREWMEWDTAEKDHARQQLRAAYESKLGRHRNEVKKYTWKNSAKMILDAISRL